MKNLLQIFIGLMVINACVHRDDDRKLSLPPTDPALNWDDLMNYSEMEDDTKKTQKVSDPELSNLSNERFLENPEAYENGVYGKIHSAVVFVSTPKKIPTFSKLYWVMVRVLSEKYGCFIRKQIYFQGTYTYTCRDSRTITLTRSRGPGWIQFVGKQYDKAGRELIVENRFVN